ncbi:MAG TPA: 3-phosphoshikimate 1-carboxyvinyltransferase [Dehalococcoidia bacterium]|nr:3-phosphoshikimate 1-carboxyvinyltransferase [Dehalococcoidia bacterium]
MRQRVQTASALQGEVHIPGDKSISHRAVILNSIAQGDARVSNFSQSDDCFSTVTCMRALGVGIETGDGDELDIHGVGKNGLTEAGGALDAGNSGTTMRILAGLLAAQPFPSVITGDESLRSRPMDRVIQPLRLMGAQISGQIDDSRAPLEIQGGKLRGIRYRLPVASAQIKSALLLAGLYAQGHTVIEEPVPCRDHTERMLKEMGAGIEVDGDTIHLSPGSLKAVDLLIPGDISAAAFWLVAGAIHPQASIRLPNAGINPTRSGILDVLLSMGADIAVGNEHVLHGEPVADLEVQSSSLRGTEIGGELIPRVIDEIPLIALAACAANGRTVIRDAQELRVKETDRISATAKELSKMGADVEELPDGMVIHGGRKLSGAGCDSHGDHRLAMMLGVAALIADGKSEIDNAEAASISYPTFWQDLGRLSAG